MDQSLLLNVIRRPLDGNDWKGDVKSRCGYCVRLRRRVAWRRRSAQDDRPALRSRNAAAARVETGRMGCGGCSGRRPRIARRAVRRSSASACAT